jgi:poly-gamma-glutamate synthesis protein (capsule biosynthesis protein)
MLARSIGRLVLAEGPAAPWEGVAEVLAGADLRVGNLETTVGDAGVAEDKAYTFRAPAESVDALVTGGLDVLTLANNHAYDYGPAGLLETVRLVRERGILTVGAGIDRRAAHAPALVEVEGVELGFLGYVDVPDDWSGYANRAWAATATSPGVAWADPAAIADDVAVLVPEVDHVVVLLHAGTEGSGEPDPTQVAAVRTALEAGASAVVGAHPHVLQGWSLQEGRLVAWSLGNTVFDGFEDPLSREAGLLVVTFTAGAVEEARLVPAVVDDRGLPRALAPDGEPGRALLDRVAALPVPDLP